MLKLKSLEKGSILALKLVDGQDIVGKLEEVEDDTFVISRPLGLILVQDPAKPNGFTIMFSPVPFILGANELPTARVMKNAVLAYDKARTEIADAWKANTSPIIQPVTKGAKIL